MRTSADIAGAMRLLMAIHAEDVAEVDRVLTRADMQPLLIGVATLALALGEKAAGNDPVRLRTVLFRLARRYDPEGVAAAMRLEVQR